MAILFSFGVRLSLQKQRCCLGLPHSCATTVTLVEEVTAGAVNSPLSEIVPALACQRMDRV